MILTSTENYVFMQESIARRNKILKKSHFRVFNLDLGLN